MRRTWVCILPVAMACAALGQEFEVVAVKPNPSGSGDSSTHGDRGRLTATNVSLKKLIVRAYEVKESQVEGPEWLNSTRFDISAKLPDSLPENRELYGAWMATMIRKMLEDRFKLSVHRVQKTLTI